MTKHGILILNFIKEYLSSKACRREFGYLDRSRIHIYVAEEDLIVPFSDLKNNPALCEKALCRYSPEIFNPIELAQQSCRICE